MFLGPELANILSNCLFRSVLLSLSLVGGGSPANAMLRSGGPAGGVGTASCGAGLLVDRTGSYRATTIVSWEFLFLLFFVLPKFAVPVPFEHCRPVSCQFQSEMPLYEPGLS